MLALFRALPAIITLLGLIGQDQQGTNALMGVISDLAPGAADPLKGVVAELMQSRAAGFGFYVANFSSYNKTYGSLAGIIVFLLWLWITNIALLFGAEVDSEIERGRQLQGGIAAEETLQLPPRDTKASDKMAEKEQADLQEARTIRDGASAGE